MQRKSLAIAAAAAGVVSALFSNQVKADSTIDYDPVVSVLGDGTTPLVANLSFQTSIDVFNNSISAQTSPLASQIYGASTLLMNSTSSAEMSLSNNGAVADAAAAGNSYSGTAYVFSAGYAGPQGNPVLAENRVVGDMTVTSAVVTNPTLGPAYASTGAYANSTFRGAVGDDTATNFWTAGNGNNGTEGFRYWNANTHLSDPPENTRTIQIRQGQLYGSADNLSSNTLFAGIAVVATGTPTPTGPNTYTSEPLFVTGASTANVSPYQFLLIKDPNNSNTPTVNGISVPFNVAYIADNGLPTGADTTSGIQKWVYNPSTSTNNGWSLAYVIGDSSNVGATGVGYFGVAGQLLTNANTANDSVVLYATTTNGQSLEQFTDQVGNDNSSNATTTDGTLTTLATAPANELFRGVALAPIVPTGPASLTWTNASANNLWDTSASSNWSNGASTTMFHAQDNVTFNDNNGGAGNYAVTLNTTVTPGSVTFSNSFGNYTVSGTGSIAGTGSLTKSGSATVTLSTLNTYTGGTNVSAGLLIIAPTTPASTTASALPKGALTISGTGKVQLATNVTLGSQSASPAAPTSNVNITSLSITGTGTLDINNNHIIINYTPGNDPIASIAAWITSGFNGGGANAWTGTGITSTAAQANSTSYGIGYADAADPGNPAGLSSGQIEVMYTLLGDANLDGKVNGSDFSILAVNFNKAVGGWDAGDFNYDGKDNGADFTDLAANFNKGANQAADLAALESFAAANGLSADVPEPASFGLLALGSIGLIARRRRKAQ